MAVVKSLMCTYALVFCSLVAGCTASDWVNVAGGVMQGRDDYGKSQRATRLKNANNVAKRMKGNNCVGQCK